MQIFISYGLQSEPICLGLLEVLSLLNLSSSNLKECLLKINLLKVQKKICRTFSYYLLTILQLQIIKTKTC